MVKKRKAKVGTVPVYLRDLSDSLQREFLGRNWDNKKGEGYSRWLLPSGQGLGGEGMKMTLKFEDEDYQKPIRKHKDKDGNTYWNTSISMDVAGVMRLTEDLIRSGNYRKPDGTDNLEFFDVEEEV